MTLPDPHAAQQLGVAIVYQERALFGPLSVAENVFPARQPVRGWRIDTRRMHAAAAELLAAVGLDVDPAAPLDDLSPAQQQLVEVAKALSLDAKLVIFDEPTASLSPAEADRLFGVVRSLRGRGVSVVYISHRLDEVFALADRITVLKDGAGQGTFAAGELTHDALVAKMVGRDVAAHQRRPDPPPAAAPAVLEVRGLTDDRLRGVLVRRPGRGSRRPGRAGRGGADGAGPRRLRGAAGVRGRGPRRRTAGGPAVPGGGDRRRDRLPAGGPQGRRAVPRHDGGRQRHRRRPAPVRRGPRTRRPRSSAASCGSSAAGRASRSGT